MSQGKLPVQNFAFPILDVPEIVEQCRTVQLQLAQEDLTHPTPVRAQQIYSFWLNLIAHITLDDITTAVNERLDLLPNPDLHREALFIGTFQMSMHQLMFRAAVDSFSVSDLNAPTRDSLVRNLSALINFYLFEREQAQEYLDPLLAEDEGLSVRREELAAKNEEMAESLRLEAEARRNNEPKAAAAQERLIVLRQQLAEKSNLANDVVKEVERTQVELKELTAENNELQKSIMTNEAELTRLKSQHVQSPERLRTNIHDLTASIAKEQESVRNLEQKERQLQAKISALSKYEQDLTGILRIMDEWEVDATKLSEASSRFQNHLDEFDSLQAQQTEIGSNIELLQRRITNASEELTRFGEKSERKRQANKQRKKSLEEHYAQLLDQKSTFDMQGAAKNREAVDLENQIRTIRDELHAELDRGESEYKKIKDQVTLYSIRLNKALDSINEVNVKPLNLSGRRFD